MAPAVIAALIAAGGIANYLEGKNKTDAAASMYDDIGSAAQDTVTANDADIARYNDFMRAMYGTAPARYDSAVSDFLNSEVYSNGDFNYGGNISEFFDPAANQREAAAMRAIEDSAASGGNRFSSDFLNRASGQIAAQSSEEWAKSYDRLMRDRQQQLTEYNANTQNGWNNYNAQNDRLKTAVSLFGNDRDKYADSYTTALTAGIANRTAGLQSQANAAGGAAGIYAQQPGLVSSVLNPMSSFLGNYFGGK